MTLRSNLLATFALILAASGPALAGDGEKQAAPANQEAAMVRAVYPVADLIVPLTRVEGKPQGTLEDRLMTLITQTVQPKSWKEQGGRGTVQYYPLGMSLVVEQSQANQEEVADLLAALRRLFDVEVAVEVRVVQLAPEFAERFRSKSGFAPMKALEKFVPMVAFDEALGANEPSKTDAGDTVTSGVNAAFLTEKELYPWLELFQTDQRTNIMQAPKVTLFNGQHAPVACTTEQPYVSEYRIARDKDHPVVVPKNDVATLGVKYTLLPTISADRKSVRLAIDFTQTSQAGSPIETPVVIKIADKEFRGSVQQPQLVTLAFKRTGVIPDGQTMAVSLGKIVTDSRSEYGPPILSRIPYVNRAFRNVGWGRDETEVFLLVTLRIIVNETVETNVQHLTPDRVHGGVGP
jgi:general secretion pathway protein D